MKPHDRVETRVVVRSAPAHCGADACGRILFTLHPAELLLATGATIERECPQRKSRLCVVHLDRLRPPKPATG